MTNPYIKSPKSKKEPLIIRFPIHDFESGAHMEQELIPYEACMARIPNLTQEGFTHHVALVYKDGNGNVYSTAMMQHNGMLKETQENYNAIQIKGSASLLSDKQTGSSEEVRPGQRESGGLTGQGEPKIPQKTQETQIPTPTTEKLKWQQKPQH